MINDYRWLSGCGVREKQRRWIPAYRQAGLIKSGMTVEDLTPVIQYYLDIRQSHGQ